MKQNNFKQSEFEEYEEFLEFKRMKQRYEIQNNKPALNNPHYEDDKEESGGGFLATLGIISFLLAGAGTFVLDLPNKQIHTGAFVFLSLFLIWGYSVNKEGFYLCARVMLFLNVGWVCWKIGLFS